MARKTKNEKIRTYSISSKLKVSDIKNFIRVATEAVNRTIRKKGTGIPQLDTMLENVKEVAVSARKLKKRGTTIEGVGYGFKGKRKEDLLKQADLLQSYLRQYSSLKSTGRFVSEQEKRAYENAVKTLGEMSLSDYRWIRDVLKDIKKDFGSKYESKDVYEDVKNYYGELGGSTFIDIVRDTYGLITNKGLEKSQFRDLIKERFEIELEMQYKLKKGLIVDGKEYVKNELIRRAKEKFKIDLE